MRSGQACGGRSSWSKAGGAKPLCVPTDITPGMIYAYPAIKAIPPSVVPSVMTEERAM